MEEEKDLDRQISEDRWRRRRSVVYFTLSFCGIGTTYLMIFGKDNELHVTIANGLLFLAGSVIAAYIGGSAYEDTRLLVKGKKKDPFR